MHLQPGATWTFVHSNGKRTEYVYERQMIAGSVDPKTGTGLSPMHALVNPQTGKLAQVTERWMREGPISSGVSETGLASHWIVGAKATMEVPEAA
jgi:hypothetical protein